MGARVVTIGGVGLYQNYLAAGLVVVADPPSIDNFQEWVEIPWCPGMALDFSNLRFAQPDDTVVLAHRYLYTPMGSAIFWFRVPDAGTREIYFYFDGGDMTSLLSTGAQVFNQYNQFAATENLENIIDNNGNERHSWFDKAQNDLTGAYDLTGTPTWASGAYTLDSAEMMRRDLASTDTEGKWEKVISFETLWTSNQYSYIILGSNSTFYVKRDDDPAGNEIWLSLTVNGSTLIAYTDTGVTLADSTYARATVTYDGTNWQMYWAGVAVGAATPGDAPNNPRIGLMAFSTQIKCIELDYIPSVAHTDPFTADTESRYMQLSSTDLTTWAASAAGDVVVDTGNTKVTLSSADDKGIVIVGRSYQYGSGEIEFAFDNNNDFGGLADITGVVFGYQGIDDYYRVVVYDDQGGAEFLQLDKKVAGSITTLGTHADVSARYTRGSKAWIKVQWDAQRGQMWAYLRDDAGVYPTAPDISDAFSSQFRYGKQGYIATVATAGAGNLNVDFFPMTIRAALLVGETNVPAYEAGFYFGDGFGSDSIGRLTLTGTWSIAAGILSCTVAGNAQMPFQTTIGVHSFLPTLANGTDYYYFGGYRIKFVASGGNQCIVTLETAAGAAQGTGSLTVTTVAGLFGAPIIITETASAITVTVAGSTGTISSGVTTSTNAYPKFTVGTATCTFDNYSFFGTLYKMTPTFRGSGQIGEYWNGSASVNATRFCDDFNWDTSAEWVFSAGSSIDTTMGRLIIGDIYKGIYPNVGILGSGIIETFYKFTAPDLYLIFASDTQNTALNFYETGNKYWVTINPTYIRLYKVVAGSFTLLENISCAITSGVLHILSIYYDRSTSSFTICVDGVLIGTLSDPGLTFTNFGYWGFTRNDVTGTGYLYSFNINALESTSTNGVCRTHGSVAHGNLWGTGITAGFLMREYETTEPTLTETYRGPNPRAARRIPTDGNRAMDVETGIGMAPSVNFGLSINADPKIGMAGSVAFGLSIHANPKIGMEIGPPRLEVTSWITAQDFRKAIIHRGLQDKYAQAQFYFAGQPDWWYYDKLICYEMPDYQTPPVDQMVFIGEAPSSDDTLAPAGDEFVLDAFDPGWYLTMQKVPHNLLVMPATTNPADYITDLLGGMFDWNATSGIYPGRIQNVADWGGSLIAIEFPFTEETTKMEAIQQICQYLNWIFIVKWDYDISSGSYIPTGFFTDFADIDDPTDIGLDIPAEVTFTYPSKYVGEFIKRRRDGMVKYNTIRIRCQGWDGTPYESLRQTPEVAAGERRPLQFPRVLEPGIFTQADLDDRADAYYAYFIDMATTYSVTLYDRPDIQFLQLVKFNGFGLPAEFNGVDMRIIGIAHEHGFETDQPINQTTIEFIPDDKFGLMNQISHLRPTQIQDIEAIVQAIIKNMGAVEAGTVGPIVGDEVTFTSETGITKTGRDVS